MQPIAVFDLDGTLVDTAPDLTASLNVCLEAEGLAPATLAAIRPHAGHGARAMLRHAYGQAGVALSEADTLRQLERFLGHYAGHIADRSRPFPGAVEALDRLAAAGYRLAVCTNKTEALARLLLEALGLDQRFAAICGADTFPARKPDPRHLLGTIDRARGRAERALMIGDTATDTDAAIAATVPCVLLDFGYAPDARAKADADVVIAHFDHLTVDLADRLTRRRD
ncbi:HAD-IA family hydrolase [Aureimonas glaciei]|uniref:Phosphoglycolate phosphatase n=1 Tax=Aureimonas glaciei TaxID=1776957 RepID=A0A916XX29_9HYPH|nr:HAD-IA family hydrolase [Aureimonas glaciei]GGD17917.1 phosphoglycolate phosphatase [Aureimonas glaciei]